MTPSTTDAREFAADAVRQAEHVAHEASRLKAAAAEAVEDGMRATRRALHDLGDLRDSATYRIKRAPLMTVAMAFGVGILLGVVVGQVTRKAAPDR